MTDYKTTLNLPHTEFSMKGNLGQREPDRLQAWQDSGLYRRLSTACQDKPKFILHDGPPYANGDIHIGHAVNKILKDIILKSKRLSGFDAPYIPGWDCHGLPIELMVEKKQGKAGDKISVREFRQACRVYAKQQVALQKVDFERLGVLGDWDSPYLTMDYQFEADIVRAVGRIVEAGHVQKGFKPVNWCLDCGSALAEAEVEYQNKRSLAIDVAFDCVDHAVAASVLGLVDTITPISVVIWTTTPWTLPANQAVSLHPDLQYSVVRVEHQDQPRRLIIASDLLPAAMARYTMTAHLETECAGRVLEGLLLQHPLYARQVPVILGQHVTVESGTGAVHTAPVHGVDDYHVGLKYGLKVDNPVDANGVFVAETPELGGQHITKAEPIILALLEDKQCLLAQVPFEHSYPHCWRHKTPIIFRATPQWFISMDQKGLRNQALQAIKEVTWVPAWGQKRIE